jgi:cobalt-zinc-cadmium efflux system outer membrane protein
MRLDSHGRSRRRVALRWTLAFSAALAGTAAGAEAPAPDLPSGSVSLRAAVAAALLHAPELAVWPWEVRAEEARALQERLPPNPSLGTEVENFGRFGGDPSADGVEASQTTVSLSQLLELGGKRGKRASVARLDGRLAEWDYERARRDAAARTLKAFVAGLVAQERLALAEEAVGLARRALGAVRSQVDAGVGSPADVVRAEASLAQADAEAARRGREHRAARIALAATWGSATAGFSRLAGTLEPPGPPRPLEDLRRALGENPDVARWVTAVERAEAGVALAEARRIPDVTLRIGSRRFVSAETNAFVAEVSVPLPVFDRNQGGVREAYERLGKTRAEQHAAAMGADAAVGVAYEELLAAFEHAAALRSRVLPRAEAALDATRRGHREGVLRWLDVLDAQRTVVDVRGEYLDSLARYHAAAADLERLTGLSVSDAGGHGK